MSKLKPTAPWAALVAIGTVLEVWALRRNRNEFTASHALRCWLRTGCPAGRRFTCAFYVALGVWLLPHLFKIAEDVLSDAE